MIPRLEFSLLGGFTLRSGDRSVATLHASRLQSLLAYLALHADRFHTRQHLAFVFWPDTSESQARNNLRQLLHQLRRALPEIERFIAIDARGVGWRQNALVSLDVFDFELALGRAEEAERATDLAACRSALEQALNIYKGDLFPGCYDDWIAPERERLRNRWLLALTSLVRLLEARHEVDAAIGYAQHLARHDPLDEDAARTLMRLFAEKGDRARALRVYHECSSTLSRELGVSPGPATREIYERLLRMDPHQSENGVPPPTPATARSLIGRQREWALLQGEWRLASGESPRVVLISGEAGIGKSRLAEDFVAWARSQGGATASTRAYAAEGQLSLAPVTDLLRSDNVRPNLERLGPVWLTEVTRLLPELTAAYPTLGRPEPISESGQRQRFFESLARAVLAAPAPLLLVIDDLQWCDQETIEWLHFLLRFDPRARLLLIGTVRADEIAPRHPLNTLLRHLRSVVDVLELVLQPLDAAETARLASQVVGRELDAEAALRLFRETEGNPLYVLEMVRAEVERSALQSSPIDWITERPSVESPALPPRVHDVIAGRLAQISEPAREILGLAAAIGREFRLDVLVQAARRDEDSAVRALDELWHKRIVREQGANAYDFTHDKLREVAYDQIGAPHRWRIHREIARALEMLHADDLDVVSGEIAAHYERTGMAEQAISYYQRAAAVAQRVYAYENAIGLLSRARALLDRLPFGSTRDRHEVKLQLALAPLFRVTKGWAAREVEEALSRALALCDAVGDERQRVQVYEGLQSLAVVQGKLAAVQSMSDRARELHERAFGTAPPRFAGVMLAGARLHLGHLREANDRFEEITAVPDPQQIRRLEESQGVNYMVLARAWQSNALWCLGFPALALQRCRAVTRLAQDLRQPFNQALAASYFATLQQWSAEADVARDAAEGALTLADVAEAPYYRAWAAILVSYSRASEHPGVEQIDSLRVAIDEFLKTGARLRLPYYRSLLARVWARAGRVTEGLVTIDEALADARARGECWWNAELYRLRGAFLDRLGVDPSGVEEELFRAIEIARDQGALSLELRAVTTLARVRRGRPELDLAREQLAALCRRFTEGFETPDLRAAQAVLTAG